MGPSIWEPLSSAAPNSLALDGPKKPAFGKKTPLNREFEAQEQRVVSSIGGIPKNSHLPSNILPGRCIFFMQRLGRSH